MKKILFMINSMGVGGAEKSLSSLLNLFDYQRYDVYLQMINRGGTFEKLLPPQVKILPSIPYFQFCGLPLVKQLTAGNIRFLKARLAVSEQLMQQRMLNDHRGHKNTLLIFNRSISIGYDVMLLRQPRRQGARRAPARLGSGGGNPAAPRYIP